MRLFGCFGCSGLSLLALFVAQPAWAGPASGCELTTEVRAGDGLIPNRLKTTTRAFGDGAVYIGSRPSDGTLVALVPEDGEYREVGLYWPTPNDPVYAYRRADKLPRNTTLLGNEADQTIIVLRAQQDFVVRGEATTYLPIDYNGFTLTIDGCGGDDTIEGGEGSDHLFDYSGKNYLRGFGGRDWLEGTGTQFNGGAGDDCITGNAGSYFADITGDEGDDVLENTGSYGAVAGGDGEDVCSAANVDACEDLGSAMCLGWI